MPDKRRELHLRRAGRQRVGEQLRRQSPRRLALPQPTLLELVKDGAVNVYEDRLLKLIESGQLRIEPEQRRNEVLGFIRGGLEDFSVSRSRRRARGWGWGIPVPGDPGQVVYVWFDALGNYVSALDYGDAGERYREWWERSDERVHVIGKGIIRFHAVYWPAILLSAGEPLPTAIFVHDYLTLGGQKLSKSLGVTADPAELAARYGGSALRWWFLRAVPRAGDADFREQQLAARADELADGLGNLINRTITLVARLRPQGAASVEPGTEGARALRALIEETPREIDRALGRFDLRSGATALWRLVDESNRFVAGAQPWKLRPAGGAQGGAGESNLDEILGVLLLACHTLARELGPFLPVAGERVERALAEGDPERGRRLFPKAPPPC